MRALDADDKSSNAVLLSEIGLDSGLDHRNAIGLLEQVEKSGQMPLSFTSFYWHRMTVQQFHSGFNTNSPGRHPAHPGRLRTTRPFY